MGSPSATCARCHGGHRHGPRRSGRAPVAAEGRAFRRGQALAMGDRRRGGAAGLGSVAAPADAREPQRLRGRGRLAHPRAWPARRARPCPGGGSAGGDRSAARLRRRRDRLPRLLRARARSPYALRRERRRSRQLRARTFRPCRARGHGLRRDRVRRAHGEDYAIPYGNAVVVQSDDPAELGAHLRRLASRPELARALRAEGRATAQRFSWPRILEVLESSWDAALARAG